MTFLFPMSISKVNFTLSFFLILFSFQNSLAIDHPFIFVKKSEYSELQSRAANWPWSVMKIKAIENATNLRYDPEESHYNKCYTFVPDLAGACALSYIINLDQRQFYVKKIENELVRAIHDIRVTKEIKNDHGENVGSANAAFMLYLVMDIMYSDLNPDIRLAMEKDCDYIADNHKSSWQSSQFAIQGIKELYHNGRTREFERIKNAYLKHILDLTSKDGVFITGPGYAYSRVYMDLRIHKKIFMDVCEYQGHHEFYSNPKLQDLYEWIFGYSVTPFNRSYTFGDTPPIKTFDHWAASALRVRRFSEKAQGYASWFIGPLRDELLKGNLLHYILSDSIPQTALQPTSRIFENGGAWLLENSRDSAALAGVMWNVSGKGKSHNHLDVNAIHIAAYGEHILRNSGYSGWGRPDSTTWQWIRHTSESSNTVLINSENHSNWRGAGISEAFIGKDLEYASGSSGQAIVNGHHQRNLIFVKPQDKKNGYFILLDEVDATESEAEVSLALHPNSASEPAVLADKEQYQWIIEGCNFSNSPTSVSLFLGTRPFHVDIRTGYKGSYEQCSRYNGKYLYSTYHTDKNKKASIVTVIFPFNNSHPLASMDRIEKDGVSGARIEHGDSIVDYVLGASSESGITFNGFEFTGDGMVYRRNNKDNLFYFVRHGTEFINGNPLRTGFKADKMTSIYMQGTKGQVISPGTNVTFYYPGITGIKVNGHSKVCLRSGPDWIQVKIGKGEHSLEFLVDEQKTK